MGVALQGKSLPRPHFFWFRFIYLFILTHFAETFAYINEQAPPLPPPQYLALMAEHLNSISGNGTTTTDRLVVLPAGLRFTFQEALRFTPTLSMECQGITKLQV